MGRKPLEIIALNENDYDQMGVYRIWFGWKFYIGSTTNSYDRIKGHINSIRAGLEGRRKGFNYVNNVVSHLNENQFIKTAFFEILEVCDKEIDLVDAEHDWLSCFKDCNECLNVNFNVHRTIDGFIVRPNGEIRRKENGRYVHLLQ
jgi:hypothetical protein